MAGVAQGSSHSLARIVNELRILNITRDTLFPSLTEAASAVIGSARRAHPMTARPANGSSQCMGLPETTAAPG